MNAGLTVFRPKEICEIVIDFETINTQTCEFANLTMKEINTTYRTTDLQGVDHLVTSARFKLGETGDPHQIHEATMAHLKDRKSKQPLSKPTAGSTFKSHPGGKSAGWYIEQAGLKGFRVGDAQVSEIHANWLENLGNAKSSEIIELMKTIEGRVYEKFGVKLEREVCYIGEFTEI